jgi:glycine/D-amino acid oxidase-like deaminating enzyme
LVEECGAQSCNFGRHGHITGAHNAPALIRLREANVWLAAEMGDKASRMLSREEVRWEIGSEIFVGGSLNAADAGVHPLNYVRSLARAVSGRGVRIFERSAAIALSPETDGLIVKTQHGAVRAKQAIFATNAYANMTSATGELPRGVIPFRSAAIATAPLPEDVLRAILPTRRMGSDTKRLLRWFRLVGDRLVFGGRGALGRDGESEQVYRRLQIEMVTMFPALRGIRVDFRWSGLVAMTLDLLPHIGRMDDRRLYAMGYNGTGVAMANLMGRYLAKMALNEPVDAALLSRFPLKPIPLHALRAPAVRAVAAWYQLLDALGY